MSRPTRPRVCGGDGLGRRLRDRGRRGRGHGPGRRSLAAAPPPRRRRVLLATPLPQYVSKDPRHPDDAVLRAAAYWQGPVLRRGGRVLRGLARWTLRGGSGRAGTLDSTFGGLPLNLAESHTPGGVAAACFNNTTSYPPVDDVTLHDQCQARFWGCLGMFGDVWGCLGTFGDVWGCLGMFGDVWGRLGTFGEVRTS